MRKVVRGAKKGRNVAPTTGIATVNSTFNNTIVTIADLNGHTICAASGGMTQKGSRKQHHAAQRQRSYWCKGCQHGNDWSVILKALAVAGLRSSRA